MPRNAAVIHNGHHPREFNHYWNGRSHEIFSIDTRWPRSFRRIQLSFDRASRGRGGEADQRKAFRLGIQDRSGRDGRADL